LVGVPVACRGYLTCFSRHLPFVGDAVTSL
jgi:hypothetical protein